MARDVGRASCAMRANAICRNPHELIADEDMEGSMNDEKDQWQEGGDDGEGAWGEEGRSAANETGAGQASRGASGGSRPGGGGMGGGMGGGSRSGGGTSAGSRSGG